MGWSSGQTTTCCGCSSCAHPPPCRNFRQVRASVPCRYCPYQLLAQSIIVQTLLLYRSDVAMLGLIWATNSIPCPIILINVCALLMSQTTVAGGILCNSSFGFRIQAVWAYSLSATNLLSFSIIWMVSSSESAPMSSETMATTSIMIAHIFSTTVSSCTRDTCHRTVLL